MPNKYIDVICSENYGAVDPSIEENMQSAGLGIMIGAVALIAVPFILMAPMAPTPKEGSMGARARRKEWRTNKKIPRKKNKRISNLKEEVQDRSMQERNRMSDDIKFFRQGLDQRMSGE